MNCHDFELELGDYVDGTLPPERVTAVETHLAACDRCRAVVADFTVIRGAARTLEPQMPAAHVWTRIAAAVELEQRRQPWWRLASGALAWKPLAAVGVMLVLLAGGTWMAWRDASRVGTLRTVAVNSQPASSPVNGVTPNRVESEVQLAEQHYTAAIGDLEKVTQTESGSLDPETANVVRANLAVLDEAIGQSREALRSEPANPAAQDSLFDALRSKVQLLQDTVALINEMRKGNQEGAARIMSGMNP